MPPMLALVQPLCLLAGLSSGELLAIDVRSVQPSQEMAGGVAQSLDVEYQLSGPAGAEVLVMGRLETTGGTPISASPRWEYTAPAHEFASIGPDGVFNATISFSGEQVRMAQVDGPWVVCFHVSATLDEWAEQLTEKFETPEMLASAFGEQPARPVRTEVVGGEAGLLTRAVLDVTLGGSYFATCYVGSEQNENERGSFHTSSHLNFEPGMREMVFQISADQLEDAGVEPPYRIVMGLEHFDGDRRQSISSGPGVDMMLRFDPKELSGLNETSH